MKMNIQYQRLTWSFLLSVVLLSLLLTTCNSSSTSIEKAPLSSASNNNHFNYRINQSFKHYLSTYEIAKSIRGEIHDLFLLALEKSDIQLSTVNIDISSSLIKDEGIETILDSIQSCEDTEEPIDIAVSLEARMNHFSSQGIATFFDRLVFSAEEKMLELNSTSTAVVEEDHDTTTDIDTNTDSDTTTNEDNGDDVKMNNETVITSTKDASKDNLNQTTTATTSQKKHFVYMESIDLGLNDIGLHGVETYKKASKTARFLKSMKKLIENQSGLACPAVLRMDNCGLGPPSCRMIGKGIINAAQNVLDRRDKVQTAAYPSLSQFGYNRRLKELYLSGNPISESGTTALAAALKIAPRIKDEPVIQILDISSCGVGDIGAEAMSLAIANNPGCVRCLNMSNNRISDSGAQTLARALKASSQKMSGKCAIDTLDLSNNADIGNDGAAALFDAIECGAISKLFLRSCSIRAEGVSELGETLGRIVSSTLQKDGDDNILEYSIDISGNKLGARKVTKKPGYSASMMNSMNSIGQKGFGFLKSGLKDIVDFGGSSLESDDEAEEEDDSIKAEEVQISDKCGAILLYDSFLESTNNGKNGERGLGKGGVIISLGMRMCNFDDDAANAMAAMITRIQSQYKRASITFDCEMNTGLDSEVVKVLKKNEANDLLEEMAEHHLDALESRRRALEAKETESRLNGFFGEDDTEESDYFFGNDESYDDNYDPYDNYEY